MTTTPPLQRLHITPLNPQLFDSIIPPSLRPSVSDLSYHAIPTFPENSYGYLTLPLDDAQRLKKKMSGAILKGRKFHIEEARPSKRSRDEDGDDRKQKKKSKKERKEETGLKKKGKDAETLPGVELPAPRHVKRGWTEPIDTTERRKSKASKKEEKVEKKNKAQRSKYTDKAECLFRAVPPPNTIPDPGTATAEQKSSKPKKEKHGKNTVVVHEFKKNVTYPTFLRTKDDGKGNGAADFVEGKGWVDKEGNVLEAPNETAKVKRVKEVESAGGIVGTGKMERSKKRTVTPESEESSEESEDESEVEKVEEDDYTSSSGSSSEESESEDSSSESVESGSESESETEEVITTTAPTKEVSTPTSKIAEKTAFSKSDADSDVSSTSDSSSSSDEDASSNEETTTAPPSAPEIHPLEALFKRPKPQPTPSTATQSTSKPPTTPSKPTLEVTTSFSFFPGDADEQSTTAAAATPGGAAGAPHTPFTKSDLLHRGIRSAAPTPDTAAPDRTTFNFGFGFGGDSDNEDDDDNDLSDLEYKLHQEDSPSRAVSTNAKAKSEGKDGAKEEGGEGEETGFQKWFWENRGENNRAWKRRRREVAKEVRQRGNRRRAK